MDGGTIAHDAPATFLDQASASNWAAGPSGGIGVSPANELTAGDAAIGYESSPMRVAGDTAVDPSHGLLNATRYPPQVEVVTTSLSITEGVAVMTLSDQIAADSLFPPTNTTINSVQVEFAVLGAVVVDEPLAQRLRTVWPPQSRPGGR